MLRRNLDVSNKLCNGSVGILKKVVVDPRTNQCDTIVVQFGDKLHQMRRVTSDFFLSDYSNLVKIQHKQFPVTLSYSLTVHKSQGITLQHAIIDCGDDIFSTAQCYVGLSRVVSSDSLILVNFNANKIDAFLPAIDEYNRLRSKIGLLPLASTQKRKRPVSFPMQPYVSKRKKIAELQAPADVPSVGSFTNPDTKCFANALLQCLFNTLPKSKFNALDTLSRIAKRHSDGIVQSASPLLSEVSEVSGIDFTANVHCPIEFLEMLLETYPRLKPEFEIDFQEKIICSNDDCLYSTSPINTTFCSFSVKATGTTKCVQDLLDAALQDQILESDVGCSQCFIEYQTSQRVLQSSRYLVIFVWPDRDGNRKLPTKIKDIPNGIIKINTTKYRFKSMIMHKGENLDRGKDNHYTAWVKDKRWLWFDDSRVTMQNKWPINAYISEGKSSAYALFYQRC